MKHKWKKEADGTIFTEHMGDFHSGPVCFECGYSFCQYCHPEGWDSECPGRKGFKICFEKHDGPLIGFRWNRKALDVGLGFVTVRFDFSGLFPYCEEVEE
jgi:hypothetical protein